MQFMEFKAFLKNADRFDNQFIIPLSTLRQFQGTFQGIFSHKILISRAASFFELKDSCIKKLSLRGKKTWNDVFQENLFLAYDLI